MECRKKFASSGLWFYSTALSDWFRRCVPFSQPMRVQTNRDLLARVFPRLAPVTCICSVSDSDWFITLLTSVAIGQIDYFGFGFTTLYY